MPRSLSARSPRELCLYTSNAPGPETFQSSAVPGLRSSNRAKASGILTVLSAATVVVMQPRCRLGWVFQDEIPGEVTRPAWQSGNTKRPSRRIVAPGTLEAVVRRGPWAQRRLARGCIRPCAFRVAVDACLYLGSQGRRLDSSSPEAEMRESMTQLLTCREGTQRTERIPVSL